MYTVCICIIFNVRSISHSTLYIYISSYICLIRKMRIITYGIYIYIYMWIITYGIYIYIYIYVSVSIIHVCMFYNKSPVLCVICGDMRSCVEYAHYYAQYIYIYIYMYICMCILHIHTKVHI